MPQPGSDAPRVEHVHGDNWLDALRRGLAAAGLPAPTRNLSCDLQVDESVVITDTGTGQVFRVAPVRGAHAASRGRASADQVPVIRLPPPVNERAPRDCEVTDARVETDGGGFGMADPFSDEFDEPMRLRSGGSTGSAHVDTLPVAPSTYGAGDTASPRPATLSAGSPGATATWPAAPVGTDPRRAAHLRRRREAVDRELTELEHLGRDIHDACNFVLDVARAHVPCGAGSVLLIDARDRCLYFAAARGPKAAVVANRRIPLEVGIAGASIRERRPLNIAQPRHDQRFASNFADTVGYHPRSLVCAPVFSGRKAFGVIELLDRDQNEAFGEDDVELLALMARRLGEHFASLLPNRREG